MEPNPSVQQVHALLVARVADLATRVGASTDPVVARALVGEMSELVHRIDMLERVLFASASAALSALVPAIEDADRALGSDLAALSSAAQVVNGVTALLAGVDRLVDLAKIS